MKGISLCLSFVLLLVVTGCGKTQVATVDFSSTIQPKQPLPEKYMKIAVRNADVTGDTQEFDQKKWSTMTADLIQYSLQQAAEKNNIPMKLVDREHMKLAMEEKDLAAAGVTDSGDKVASAQLEGAAAVLTSKVTIKIDKQKGKGRTITDMGGWGGHWGGGGGVGSEEVEKESRNITVQCQFQLKDPASNEIIISHTGKPSQHYTKAGRTSPFFGGSKTESDMTPRDKIIGEMIDRQLRDFLVKFVPTEIDATAIVKPSKHEMSAAGVRALVADDYETALQDFKQAIAADTTDFRSMFGAGVACEKLKKYDEALKYYKQALSFETKNEEYAQAVDRLSAMK
jgi:tetratricopeptide (TPR) repeat protein